MARQKNKRVYFRRPIPLAYSDKQSNNRKSRTFVILEVGPKFVIKLDKNFRERHQQGTVPNRDASLFCSF